MLYRLLWRPGIKSIKIPTRISYSSVVLQLQSQIQHHDLAELPQVWEKALQGNRHTALSSRYAFYQRLRSAGFPTNSDWSLIIFSAIPQNNIRFADYQYATEVLLHFKRWTELHKFLTELAFHQHTLWQQLVLWMLNHSDESLPARFTLETLAVSCIKMGMKLEDLASNADQPIFQMLKLIESRFSPETILDALRKISEENMVIAAPLATSLLSMKCDVQMQTSGLPSPIVHSGELSHNDLAQLLYQWKSKWSVTTSADLHLYMLYLVYQRRPREALDLYDKSPKLHDATQFDVVLLAAGVDSDFVRLQKTFEAVENDPSIIVKVDSHRYATVLRALGYIGNANVLDTIYYHLGLKDPSLLTRGVFHALIHSHGLRGDLERAVRYYELMAHHGIEPSSTSFKLVLRAYKDAKDLHGALQFVGDEMIARHQFPLGNPELSLLLALCAARHDLKSAEYVWKWGSSLCKPDQLSWQARLHCYAQANKFKEAECIFEQLCELYKPSIDTLTVLLQAGARFKESPLAHKAIEMKQKLRLSGDAAWYVALLQYHKRSGNLNAFEATISEMNTQGIRLNPSHYAVYTELLAKTKKFERAKKLPEQMAKNRVPVTHAFIGKHFRMLTAPGSSTESALSAEQMALEHVNEGYFDPHAAMVPRGVIPVRNVKPIVRRLIKREHLGPAKQLLDSLRTTRRDVKPQDTYQLWALYIEIAYAAKKYTTVNKLWEQFMRDLSKVFVLVKGAQSPAEQSVFKLARRHRHAFWKEMNAKIDSMAHQGNRRQFFEFPEKMKSNGLELTASNWNVYVQGLLKLKEPKLAFETAEKLYNKRINLSRLTFDRLRAFVGDVDVKKYGMVGVKAQKLAKHFEIKIS